MCGSVCSLRKGVGVTAAVVAVVLLAITAIALSAIFAPPFFATALLGIAALPVAVSAGIGALVAVVAALILFKKSGSVNEDSATKEGDLPYLGFDQLVRQHQNFKHFQQEYANYKLTLANLDPIDNPATKAYQATCALLALMDNWNDVKPKMD